MTSNAASCLNKFGKRSFVLVSQRHHSSSCLNLSINGLLLFNSLEVDSPVLSDFVIG